MLKFDTYFTIHGYKYDYDKMVSQEIFNFKVDRIETSFNTSGGYVIYHRKGIVGHISTAMLPDGCTIRITQHTAFYMAD